MLYTAFAGDSGVFWLLLILCSSLNFYCPQPLTKEVPIAAGKILWTRLFWGKNNTDISHSAESWLSIKHLLKWMLSTTRKQRSTGTRNSKACLVPGRPFAAGPLRSWVPAGRSKQSYYACAQPSRVTCPRGPGLPSFPGLQFGASKGPSTNWLEASTFSLRGRIPVGAERSVRDAHFFLRRGVLFGTCRASPCFCGRWPAVGRVARPRWYFGGPLEIAVRGCKGRGSVSGAGWRRWCRRSSARICSGRRRRELWLLQFLRRPPPPPRPWLRVGVSVPPYGVLLASGRSPVPSLWSGFGLPKQPPPTASETAYQVPAENRSLSWVLTGSPRVCRTTLTRSVSVDWTRRAGCLRVSTSWNVHELL